MDGVFARKKGDVGNAAIRVLPDWTVLRVLLIVVLVHGLVPGIGELIETVVHRVVTGHFAHVSGDVHDDEQSPEHGCGATAHRCGCCVSLPMLAGLRVEIVEQVAGLGGVVLASDRAPSNQARPALFRPPIS
jgi:hypothetical protein